MHKNHLGFELRQLWQLTWPVLIGQLATVGMGVVDVAMTGHLSAVDLASVSIGANVWSIILVTVIGVMMSVNTIVAHEVGAEQLGKLPHIVRQSLWLGFFTGVIAAVAMNLATLIFNYLQMEQVVNDKASTFVHIVSLGMPAFVMYRALYGYTTSLNQTKPVMVIAIIGLLFNIVFNWIFIYGRYGMPQLGSTGCAAATALGMWLMLGLMIWWVKRSPAYQATQPFGRFEAPCWNEIRSALKLGLPIGVTYFAEVSAFGAVGLLIARFGVVPVSANQITLNFSSLVFMVPMSIGIALTTLTGQALGEGNPQRARFVSWLGVGLSLSFAVFSALMIILFRAQIVAAYTSDLAVQQLAMELLLFAALFQLSDAQQVTTACAVRGYKVTRTPMLIHLLAFYGFALPIGIVLGLAPSWLPFGPAQPMAAHGFWIGIVVGLTVAAVALTWFLHKVSSRLVHRAA